MVKKELTPEEQEAKQIDEYFKEVDRLAEKQNNEEKLLPSEKIFWDNHIIKVEQAKAQRQKELDTQRRENAYKEYLQLKKEFEEAPETEKLTIGAAEEGKIKASQKNYKIANFLTKRVIKQAKQKGGSIILKCFGDSSIQFIWSKVPIKFIEFVEMNENNEEIKNICRVVKTKHRLKGTSIPIHLCAEGIFENINLFEGAEVDLSAEYVNKSVVNAYQGGLHRGLGMKQQMGMMGKIGDYMPIMMIILIGLVIIMIYMMSQLWEAVGALGI